MVFNIYIQVYLILIFIYCFFWKERTEAKDCLLPRGYVLVLLYNAAEQMFRC
jgi:4-hydroxybenzoate polyprenyltransferase